MAAPVVTQGIDTRQVPVEATPANQTIPLRRSQRQTKSTFDGHQTLRYELGDFEAIGAFQQSSCYSFSKPHDNNKSVAERGYYKL